MVEIGNGDDMRLILIKKKKKESRSMVEMEAVFICKLCENSTVATKFVKLTLKRKTRFILHCIFLGFYVFHSTGLLIAGCIYKSQCSSVGVCGLIRATHHRC